MGYRDGGRYFERRDDHQYDKSKNFERRENHQYDRNKNSTVRLRSSASYNGQVSRDGGRYATPRPGPGAGAYGRDTGRDTGWDSGGWGKDTGGWGRGTASRGGSTGSGGGSARVAGADAMGVWAAPAPAPDPDLAPTPTPRPTAAPRLSSSPGPIISGGLHKYNNQSYKEGDWNCTSCGDHQFAKNKMCRSCGAPKPAVFESDQGVLPTVNNDWPKREDHWMHPAPAPRAARPNFPPEPPRFPPEPPHFPPEPPFSLNLSPRTAGRSHRPVEVPAAPAPRSTQPKLEGDWYCPACGDHQFAKNVVCRSCGFPKPVMPGMGGGHGAVVAYGGGGYGGDAGGGGASYGHYGPAPTAASRGGGGPYIRDPVPAFNPKDGFRPGDWGCPKCGDHQFAKNTSCRKCGTSKPTTVGTMLKPGDWICPNPECGDVQFAKNDTCRKCGEDRPPEAF